MNRIAIFPLVVAVISAGLFNPLDAQEGKISFKHKLLTIDANEGIDIADIDGDGKNDVVAGRNWYQAPISRPVRFA